jgi:uncharacterized membrane protein
MSSSISKTIMASIITSTLSASTSQAMNMPSAKKVPCYGIVKAKMNDCGTSKHSCATQAKKDANGNEWIALNKDDCKRIVGASLKPLGDKKNTAYKK